jgi:hypothetical protein
MMSQDRLQLPLAVTASAGYWGGWRGEMMDDFKVLADHQDRRIRLTHERWQHIVEHPEMLDQHDKLIETLTSPSVVIESSKDSSILAYHRFYERTPVTRKYLVVIVKILLEDAFVVTAFFSNRQKKGTVIWPPQL